MFTKPPKCIPYTPKMFNMVFTIVEYLFFYGVRLFLPNCGHGDIWG